MGQSGSPLCPILGCPTHSAPHSQWSIHSPNSRGWSCMSGIKKARFRVPPLALGCAAVAVLVFGGLTYLGWMIDSAFGGSPPSMEEVERDFQRNLKDREMIVAWVKAGKLKEFEPNSFR